MTKAGVLIVATINFETEGSTLILTVTGDLTAEEVIYAITNIYPVDNPKDIVWDLTNASLRLLSLSNFETIARVAKESAATNGLRRRGKTTHVVDSAAEYGLFRMYTVIAEMTGVPFEYSVYKTIEEARRWLTQNTVS